MRRERDATAEEILPDVLDHGLAVVFCGSAASRASARAGAYYAGPGNRFWPTLHSTGMTPRLIEPGEFRTVLAFGIGLTDMAKTVSGGDAELPEGADDPAALRRKIETFRPAIVGFVGKRAAQVFLGRAAGYGPQAEGIGLTRLYVLPSPSGAARRWWDERRWSELAALAASGR